MERNGAKLARYKLTVTATKCDEMNILIWHEIARKQDKLPDMGLVRTAVNAAQL